LGKIYETQRSCSQITKFAAGELGIEKRREPRVRRLTVDG